MRILNALIHLSLVAATVFAVGCDDGDSSESSSTTDTGQGAVDSSTVDLGVVADAMVSADAAGADAIVADAAADAASPDAAVACVDGARSCPCGPADTCDDGLMCDRGFCVDDDTAPCDVGTQGCPCAEGMCAAGLECTADVCVPAGCVPGTADCACDNGACGGELVCTDGICGMGDPPPTDGVHIEGAMVFGCDALFYEQGGAKVANVTFDEAIIGEHMRRDGKLALAFIGRDGPILNVGAIVLEGQRVATAADLELRNLVCFDANGRALDGARIVLE